MNLDNSKSEGDVRGYGVSSYLFGIYSRLMGKSHVRVYVF